MSNWEAFLNWWDQYGFMAIMVAVLIIVSLVEVCNERERRSRVATEQLRATARRLERERSLERLRYRTPMSTARVYSGSRKVAGR